jgi:uncharacterized protein (DUF302 family)
MDPKGVVVRQSRHSVKETIDLLQEILMQRGATIYKRINQQTEVGTAGQSLLPLEFIMFGNPQSGGPLMLKNPLVALDLPLKVIAWMDEEEKVWVAYNDGTYIEERYSLKPAADSPLFLDGLIDRILH